MHTLFNVTVNKNSTALKPKTIFLMITKPFLTQKTTDLISEKFDENVKQPCVKMC